MATGPKLLQFNSMEGVVFKAIQAPNIRSKHKVGFVGGCVGTPQTSWETLLKGLGCWDLIVLGPHGW